MTAREILLPKRECYVTNSTTPIFLEESAIEAMKQYAKLKCEEQRESCALSCDDTHFYKEIKNAPEPIFD